MTALIAIRHGPTAWNETGRIQGRSDQPLSAQGRAEVRRWRLDPAWTRPGWRWLSSPLARARETAALLHPAAPAEIAPALSEMDWGDWEGKVLVELRAVHATTMAADEARGLDFRPPRGESPRDVQDRLRPLLAALAADGRPTVAICHKGVIRALIALASGWDMTGDPPEKLRKGCAHAFTLDRAGAPRIARLNIPLVQ